MFGTRSVLIVEDVPEVARLCSTFLELAGARVRIAESAADALLAAQEELPDVIIADASLPDGQCCALWRAMGELSPDRHVPLVVLGGDKLARLIFSAGGKRRRPLHGRGLTAVDGTPSN